MSLEGSSLRNAEKQRRIKSTGLPVGLGFNGMSSGVYRMADFAALSRIDFVYLNRMLRLSVNLFYLLFNFLLQEQSRN